MEKRGLITVILAAGYATRLYPLTENFPKPLLKVKGKTILDWLLDDLDSSGVADGHFVVTNSRFAGIFKDWAKQRRREVTVLDDGTCTNEGRLGAVRDLAFALQSIAKESDVLVMAGDNLLDFSLLSFIEYARTKKTSCVMRFYQPDLKRLRKSGVLEVSADDRILSMEEKPEHPRSNWSCPPFYYLRALDVPMVSKAVSGGCATDAPGSFISWLSERTDVHAMEMPGTRFDIGTIETFEIISKTYSGISTGFRENSADSGSYNQSGQ